MVEYSVETEKIEALQEEYERVASKDFMYFIRGLCTMGANGVMLFDESLADFQLNFFKSLAPNIEAVREGRKPKRRRYWLERTKKSSKDTDISACVLWLIAFSERPLLIQICASNRAQAGIVEDRALQLIHYNPWLSKYVELVGGWIRNKKMPKEITARIESTTTGAAAQGPTPDLLVLNELVHVDRWSVMEAHMNNADGVPNGVVIVSTNAGVKGSKAHAWRKNAQTSPERWECHIWSKKAPWLSDADMEDARKRDPIGKEFSRLWKGVWVSGTGDAVDEGSLNNVFTLSGPHLERKPGYRYIGAYDLGISHDHSGICFIGVDVKRYMIEIARVVGFEPEVPNDRGVLEVDIAKVKAAILSFSKTFRVEWMGYDPAAGGSFLAQELRRLHVPVAEWSFASEARLTDMAKAYVLAVKAGKLKSYEDPEGRVRRDFGKFSIEHKPPSTYKLKAVSDEFGHADVGTAIMITLPKALEMIDMPVSSLMPDDIVYEAFDEELTPEEEKELPDELKDIYNIEEDLFKEGVIKKSGALKTKKRPLIDDFDDIFKA